MSEEKRQREVPSPGCRPAASGSADLASKIAREIMEAGDFPTPCQRIQFMGGTYPGKETNQGGFTETALVDCIRDALRRHLPNTERTNGGPDA